MVLSESSFERSIELVRRAMVAACGWENLFYRLKAWTEAKVKLREVEIASGEEVASPILYSKLHRRGLSDGNSSGACGL